MHESWALDNSNYRYGALVNCDLLTVVKQFVSMIVFVINLIIILCI